MEVIITDHAYKRAKERLSWKKGTIKRMALLAFTEGLNHKEVKGKLKKFVDKIYLQHKTASGKIYGQNIYLFSNNRLITIYRVPNELLKYLKL